MLEYGGFLRVILEAHLQALCYCSCLWLETITRIFVSLFPIIDPVVDKTDRKITTKGAVMTKPINYRVISIMTDEFGKYNHGHPAKIVETIKWSGNDIDELSRKYPPSEIYGADPLEHKEIEDGLIRFDYRFERQSDDESWEEIGDPRRRITPLTSLERAIEAENRRDFPGDYITCDICGTDDHDQRWCDNRPPDCKECGDYGCDVCDPPRDFDEVWD